MEERDSVGSDQNVRLVALAAQDVLYRTRYSREADKKTQLLAQVAK